MHRTLRLRAFRLFVPCLLCSMATVPSMSAADCDERQGKLIDSRSSSAACVESDECIFVFAAVGERFVYPIEGPDRAPPSACRQGVGASGEACALPDGVVFDAGRATLAGVPRKAGFHEFVVQVRAGAKVKEQVILIDIEDKAAARGLDSYAAYFFGGIR